MCKLFDMLFNKRNNNNTSTESNFNEFIEDANSIIIERFCYAPKGVFGKLHFDGFSCFTVEREWQGNEPYVSCIPDGNYTCSWYDSPRFGRTLAIVGDTVSLFPSPNHERSGIMFHLGNWPRNFNGCIGLGRSFTCINGEMGVTSSRDTVNEFLSLFQGKDDILLKIVNTAGTK